MAAADIKIPNGFSQDALSLRVIGLLGIQKPSNFGEMVKRYPELFRDYYFASLEAEGKIKMSTNQFFDQWVDLARPFEAFKVTATVTGSGAGAVATATLTNASHMGTGGVLSPPAVGHFFTDDLNGIEYVITAVNKSVGNAHTVSLKPTDAADTVTLTTASFLKWSGRLSAQEGSDQLDGMYRGIDKRRRQLSIVRTDKKYTDLATMETTDYNGMTLYDMDKTDMMRRHNFSKEQQLMKGKIRNNIDAAGTGTKNSDAEGLIQQIARWGVNLGTGITINDTFWKNVARRVRSNGYVRDYTILGESEVGYAITDYLAAKLGYTGAVIYGQYDGKSEIDVAFNFGKFDIYNTSWKFKEYALFDAAYTHGQDFEQVGEDTGRFLVIPNGTVIQPDQTTSDFLTIRYQEFAGKMNHIGTDGSFFGKNTENVAEISVTSYIGLESYLIDAFSMGKITV